MFKPKKVRIVQILESISKSKNSAKSSIVIASSTETSSASENGKKLDMILKVHQCRFENPTISSSSCKNNMLNFSY